MRALTLFACVFLTGCTLAPSLIDRIDQAEKLAADAGWEREDIPTPYFTLRAYNSKFKNRSKTLTIYIEGDGLAWVGSSTPSQDPTPVNPLALKLAVRDEGAVAYLARPCQFVGIEHQPNCTFKYWTSHRFNPEVIDSVNQAVDQLKQSFTATQLILVGYSGGGAVAALVAAKRNDIARLITIAGNLDHRAWTIEHHVSPLSGSLNPADFGQALQLISQTHFVGGKDKTVGESVARSFATHFSVEFSSSVVVIPEFDHHCCWESQWPALKNEHYPGYGR